MTGLGSGVLLAPDWVLTARRVPGERCAPADLLAASGTVRYPVADLIASEPEAGLALLRLAGPAAGVPPAALVAGLVAADLRRDAGRLIAAGYPGASAAADPLSYAVPQTWLAARDPAGRVLDWPPCADLPAGLGGGALCLDRPPDWPLLGLLERDGEGAPGPRVIPSGAILDFLWRAAPGLAGRLRTLAADAVLTRTAVPSCAVGRATWDQERGRLRDLLVDLPDWELVSDRRDFVKSALGRHPAARHEWGGTGFTVAGDLVRALEFYDAAPLPDGRHPVCGLLTEARARDRHQNRGIAARLRALAAAFGCQDAADAAGDSDDQP